MINHLLLFRSFLARTHNWVRGLRPLLLALLFLSSLEGAALSQEPFLPLRTEELSNQELLQNIYLGRFDRIPRVGSDGAITDYGLAGRQAMLSYVVAYSDQCQDSLPSKKVPIIETITTYVERQQLWTSKYGAMVIPTSTEKVSTETRFTGVFADPKFADAYTSIVNATGIDALALLLRDLHTKRSDNLLGASLNMFRDILEMSVGSRVLIARSGCTSRQIRYYSDNLLNYVSGGAPAQRDEAFLRNCRREIGKIIPQARPQSCACLEELFSRRANKRKFWDIEDNFTEQNFLSLSVSKVDLHKEVAACLK